MDVLTVILGIAVVILLLLFVLQIMEMKIISNELKGISGQDSNELVHSGNGVSSNELINEINILLKEMQSVKIEYRKKNHDLEQMMTNISHDLRTPLTSAIGYINIIIESDLSPEEKEKQIRIVEQRLLRLEELINSFFEFSKVISCGQKPALEPINLVEVLQEAIAHYYDDFCREKREISFVCDKLKLMVNSNREMLIRIFDNLIANAYKHGEGELKVTVLQSENICICFENELYSSDIDTDRVFDEFYTTEISRTKGNTGLGLAIAKQFTQMLGGSIYAEYKEELFTITVEIAAL